MTTPSVPAATDQAQRRLVVFVHGFGSSAACWDPLLGLLKDDARLTRAFDVVCYEYPTAWFNKRFLRRLPRLLEIARGLDRFLESQSCATYHEVVLVGHSQGGLVIQSYLADKLSRGKAEDLYRLREVILIATPNLGSTLLSGVRKVLFGLFANPQERILRVFDTEITELRAIIAERIVGAHGDEAVAWPIPVQCFWGTQDGVVVEASARGPFDTDSALPLDGDHFSILQPKDHDDPRFTALAEALLEPCGHRCVLEADSYDISIAVRPADGTGVYDFPHGGRTIRVQTDNVGTVDRTLKISRRNRCTDLFMLRYATRNDGYLKPEMSHANEAMAQDTVAFEDRGNAVAFGFHPKKGESYRLVVEVYKGFDRGHRDAHFHLVPQGRRVYYKKVCVRLDLAAFMAAGWTVSKAPALYLHRADEGHSEMCQQRHLSEPAPYVRNGANGRWEWEFSNLRQGVIDVVWDVAAPVSAGALASAI